MMSASCAELERARAFPEPVVAEEALFSCKVQCPLAYEGCGHPCQALCHAGPCPNAEKCRKKRTLRCPCRREKKDFRCWEVQQAEREGGEAAVAALLPCGPACEASNKSAQAEAASRRARKAEADQAAAAAAKAGSGDQYVSLKKKRKDRKLVEYDDAAPSFLERHGKVVAIAIAIIAVLGGLAWIIASED